MMMRMVFRKLWHWLRGLLRLSLALLILFEEWGWSRLARGLARIGELPVFRQLERWIAGLPPYAALVVFLLPGLLLLPVKLLALWLISLGRAGLGLAVIIVAKLIGTALLARVFQLTQPALMRLSWFARLYARWARWKNDLLAWVRASSVWRTARVIKLRVRRLLSRFRG